MSTPMRKIIWTQPMDELSDDIELSDSVNLSDMLQGSNLLGMFEDFDFWILHSNFTITLNDIDHLKRLPGIESLDVISQYRLRISIGELFDADKVKEAVSYILDCTSDSDFLGDESKEKVEELIRTFKEDKLWAILVLPNGQIITHVGSDDKTYKEKLQFFEKIKELTSCQLITSE